MASGNTGKFAVGDRVRCVCTVLKDELGTITAVYPGFDAPLDVTVDSDGWAYAVTPEEVELDDPAPADAFERHEVEECSCPDCTGQDEPTSIGEAIMGWADPPAAAEPFRPGERIVTFEVEDEKPASDAVFRPSHYARFTIEPLTFINANKLPYNVGNVIKYVCRYDAKNGLEDLKKARRYIDIQIECLERDDRVAAGEDPNVVWSLVL